MKKRKVEKKYLYDGFGFPLVLLNVPMIQVRGEWVPDIKWNRLEKIVLLILAHQPGELTGNQIRFIRHSMQMNQRNFSKLFGVTHAAVVKWEKAKDHVPKMHTTTQLAMRLCILDNLIQDDSKFRKSYHNIISHGFQKTPEQLEIDTQTDLLAI